MSTTLKVTLEAKPNPDYEHTDYRGRVNIKKQTMTVKNFRQASEVCRMYIEHHELGGGNWTGGDIYQGRKQIAHVSYNGRVWWGKLTAPRIGREPKYEEVLFFKEFPDIEIPYCLSYGKFAEGWTDESWGNDAAPRMQFPYNDLHTIEVWCYELDREDREGKFEHRYSVCVYNDSGDLIGDPIDCDDEDQIMKAVMEKYSKLEMISTDIARREIKK